MFALHVATVTDDYGRWHDAFAQAEGFRAGAGVTAYRVTRNLDDPTKVYVDLGFCAKEQAEHFIGVLQNVWDSNRSRCVARGHDRPQVREILDVHQYASSQHR